MDIALYTWEMLSTAAGATAATLLVVQYVKGLIDRLVHVPTRLVAFVVALAITVGAQSNTTGVAWPDVPLLLINAFVVAFAAMGAYDASLAERDEGDNVQ